MNALNNLTIVNDIGSVSNTCQSHCSINATGAPGIGLTEPDDNYPGSFFRVPGVPTPGKTTWSVG